MHKKKYAFHNSDEEWKEKLSELEYHVMRKKGTEAPFLGEYTDFIGNGVYYCKGCDVQLFSSGQKFQSSCGWPSFDDELDSANIEQIQDNSLGMNRTEIVCGNCGSHLGHIFNDGPTETGKRYCVNSISLVHKE
ncbi:MAG: peptide-methionine (R)-S-oxide reductase MsrB [Flavobacteriales bacterium]|nr:peptide-methionine (R)-S-oxide reductase MsrB [Flavobacteriales bacterium]